MKLSPAIKLFLLVSIALSLGCAKTEQDFCKYLSLEETQEFDATISSTEMRQTERILYCVYKNEASDRLFISLDQALKYSSKDFLEVLAKNSPEKVEEIITLPSTGIDAAALFLGNDDELKLDFLLAQNSKYSVTIRAHDVTSADADKVDKLKSIAVMVLSRI
jgi:hypothetical protein